MALSSIGLTEELAAYLVAHGTSPDDVQQRLIEETAALGGVASMQISPEQGAFMTMLTRLLGVRRAIEIGTFTGYSALCIARGLEDDGELVCCDVSEEWTTIAQRYWRLAGIADRIRLEIRPALETLRALPGDQPFDMAFVDAEKTEYADYYAELLRLVRPGGVILVDNVLFSGRVLEPQDDRARAIAAFNDLVLGDGRVEQVMLPIGDGLSLIRVR